MMDSKVNITKKSGHNTQMSKHLHEDYFLGCISFFFHKAMHMLKLVRQRSIEDPIQKEYDESIGYYLLYQQPEIHR